MKDNKLFHLFWNINKSFHLKELKKIIAGKVLIKLLMKKLINQKVTKINQFY